MTSPARAADEPVLSIIIVSAFRIRDLVLQTLAAVRRNADGLPL